MAKIITTGNVEYNLTENPRNIAGDKYIIFVINSKKYYGRINNSKQFKNQLTFSISNQKFYLQKDPKKFIGVFVKLYNGLFIDKTTYYWFPAGKYRITSNGEERLNELITINEDKEIPLYLEIDDSRLGFELRGYFDDNRAITRRNATEFKIERISE